MYHKDRRPVGLYREAGNEKTRLLTGASSGNFGLLPNGVFYKSGKTASVMESKAFKTLDINPDYATQSGPMLVIDGKLHPKFKETSESLRVRNGVGISGDGETLYFVVSQKPVNFHRFGRFFKDRLKTPNALYLDGGISRLHDPANDRSDPGRPMGPIVGLVKRVGAP
jgi:uncharacterized protein YigE (DUF2233 family)